MRDVLKYYKHDRDQRERTACLRNGAVEFRDAIENALEGNSRFKRLAMTRLEEALMWAIKGISMEDGEDD